MRKLWAASVMAAAALTTAARPVEACGGFFCGRQPVDQTAERILFATNQDGSVTMVTQIQYAGAAPDFAWVVPLAEVPAADSLAVFPQLALTALDTATGPQFQWPDDPSCSPAVFDGAGAPTAGGVDDGGVTVHIREEVGPYDVAVIESTDPTALVEWLRDNEFRVNDAMAPYIRIYTSEGMKFLALRLQPDAEVSDIQPFRFTLPSGSPSIPIRLTAIAAEPEMGITVMILGDRRYGPANWPDVEIDDDQIVWRPNEWPMQTNWTALVARGVDEAGGRGFVTEMSGPTASIAEQVRNTMSSDEEQVAARDALLPLLEGNTTITRLYTRLSPEEMTVDPIFRRTDGPEVSNVRVLPRYVEGRDLCVAPGAESAAASPCDFAACGAGGLCRVVEVAGGAQPVAACACVPGTTARTTFDPSGRPTVTCQDLRMSFLNPGDRALPDAPPLADPCATFDCGANGECVPMNMTPTCRCSAGYVAVGAIAADGGRETTCVLPDEPVPASFYERRVPQLPDSLPGGRPVDVPPPAVEATSGGGCSTGSRAGSAGGLGGALLGLLFAVRRRRRS